MMQHHGSLFDQTNGVIDLDVEGVRMDRMSDEERLSASTAGEVTGA